MMKRSGEQPKVEKTLQSESRFGGFRPLPTVRRAVLN